tara:strand:+ start:1830 stop:2624 length:795 start_codon:yes stop_codon:yes gene_type:complete
MNIKIIRFLWGHRKNTLDEIPKFPLYPKNEIVYVWGKENEILLKERGYKTRYVEEETSPYAYDLLELIYERKVIALDLALKEFGEVILLDWDCYILRPLDNNFLTELRKKPIQVPLYTQHKDCYNALYEVIPENHPWFKDPKEHAHLEKHLNIITRGFLKWNWEWEEGLISPNFGFVYSRDITLGEKLIKIGIDNNMEGCVEEHAMFVYADCSLDEYIKKFHPTCLLGVSDEVTHDDTRIGKIQNKFNTYIKNNLKMDIYFEHI